MYNYHDDVYTMYTNTKMKIYIEIVDGYSQTDSNRTNVWSFFFAIKRDESLFWSKWG